jgi:hypothetical protein
VHVPIQEWGLYFVPGGEPCISAWYYYVGNSIPNNLVHFANPIRLGKPVCAAPSLGMESAKLGSKRSCYIEIPIAMFLHGHDLPEKTS